MKNIAISIFITMLFGCNNKIINIQEVEEITLISNLREPIQDTLTIQDKQQIKILGDIINKAKREPVKFLADYRLELKFKDKVLNLLVQKDLLNNQGITYRLNDDIGKKISKIKATH
jgi:hypothetical protein